MKIIFIVLIGFITTLNGYSQNWILQQSNTTEHLNCVYFIDSIHGCAVGNNGTICKTSDGGANWVLQLSGTTNDIRSVYYTDILTGFAVTHNELLKTTDGGSNWFIQDTMVNGFLSPIFFVGVDTGYVVGNGRMLKTVDNGANWTKLNFASNFSVRSLWATDSKTLYLGGSSLFATKSMNGGLSWTTLAFGSYGNIESIFFTNQNTGYFIGGSFAQGHNLSVFWKTTNGGASWSYPLNQIGKWLMSISFTDSVNGYMTAQDGSILKTIDAGNNWAAQNSNVTSSLNSIFFPDSLTGYTVGDSGIILKTINGGVGLDEIATEKNVIIFPNPTSHQLTIDTELEILKITIIDIAGKNIMITNQNMNTINIADLTNGIYFIKIITEGNTITKKFVKQ